MNYGEKKQKEQTSSKERKTHDGLGNGLTDSVDLGNMSSSIDANTNIDVLETVLSNNEERLLNVIICVNRAKMTVPEA